MPKFSAITKRQSLPIHVNGATGDMYISIAVFRQENSLLLLTIKQPGIDSRVLIDR